MWNDGIKSISLLCPTQNAIFFPQFDEYRMDGFAFGPKFVCLFFFPAWCVFLKLQMLSLNQFINKKKHAYYNHNNKTKTNSSSNHFNSSPHIKPKTGKCFAALTEQGPGVRGQGSAWFPSEQICKNKYITCPIIHSVADWQSGAFFLFFFSSLSQSSFRAARGTNNHQKGNFKTDHSVILTRWRIFKAFKQNSGQHTSYYTLQIVGKLDIWLSRGAICLWCIWRRYWLVPW